MCRVGIHTEGKFASISSAKIWAIEQEIYQTIKVTNENIYTGFFYPITLRSNEIKNKFNGSESKGGNYTIYQACVLRLYGFTT
jgi:hypothetical protein